MDKKRVQRIKTCILFGLALVMLLGSVFFLGRIKLRADRLITQDAAERWRGESELPFTQMTCLVPADEEITVQKLYEFRYSMLEAFQNASLDADDPKTLFCDAWSRKDTVHAAGDKGKGTVSVYAVGGDYFLFHPIRLLYGSYLAEDDFMKDRVLLDEETAWLLFGGVDLEGMSLTIEGIPFVVGGIIEREQDAASEAAYSEGVGIYMSFEAYSTILDKKGIDCYEVVMPEPVSGFANSVIGEKFPTKNALVIQNTKRYSIERLTQFLKDPTKLLVQTAPIRIPYWENAARITEARCTEDLRAAILLAIYPLICFCWLLVRLFRKLKGKAEEEWIPAAVENTEEVIRAAGEKRLQRKRKK